MRPLWNTKDRYIHNIFIPANFLQIRNDDGSFLNRLVISTSLSTGHFVRIWSNKHHNNI